MTIIRMAESYSLRRLLGVSYTAQVIPQGFPGTNLRQYREQNGTNKVSLWK